VRLGVLWDKRSGVRYKSAWRLLVITGFLRKRLPARLSLGCFFGGIVKKRLFFPVKVAISPYAARAPGVFSSGYV
jgi:hypothetical protein